MNKVKAVVGAIYNTNGQLLIAKRQQCQFMGGYWELPGGKIEVGETPKQALVRELKEELGIRVNQLFLHQTMVYNYPDRQVSLSIYHVSQYQNTPLGVEGQEIAWVDIDVLNNHKLLPTMQAFIHSITLPNQYWITPAENHQTQAWKDKFEQKLTQGITLIQLRAKIKLDNGFIKELYSKCQQNNVKLLLNTLDKTFDETDCDGWHITTKEMHQSSHRPCADDKLLGVSTHNLNEAFKAQNIGADFIVISPVQSTQTHPNAPPLGWKTAQNVVQELNIPVYFLGGMRLADLSKTLKLGAQGIAGVSAF